jgi:hypothetical protein
MGYFFCLAMASPCPIAHFDPLPKMSSFEMYFVFLTKFVLNRLIVHARRQRPSAIGKAFSTCAKE